MLTPRMTTASATTIQSPVREPRRRCIAGEAAAGPRAFFWSGAPSAAGSLGVLASSGAPAAPRPDPSAGAAAFANEAASTVVAGRAPVAFAAAGPLIGRESLPD